MIRRRSEPTSNQHKVAAYLSVSLPWLFHFSFTRALDPYFLLQGPSCRRRLEVSTTGRRWPQSPAPTWGWQGWRVQSQGTNQ